MPTKSSADTLTVEFTDVVRCTGTRIPIGEKVIPSSAIGEEEGKSYPLILVQDVLDVGYGCALPNRMSTNRQVLDGAYWIVWIGRDRTGGYCGSAGAGPIAAVLVLGIRVGPGDELSRRTVKIGVPARVTAAASPAASCSSVEVGV